MTPLWLPVNTPFDEKQHISRTFLSIPRISGVRRQKDERISFDLVENND